MTTLALSIACSGGKPGPPAWDPVNGAAAQGVPSAGKGNAPGPFAARIGQNPLSAHALPPDERGWIEGHVQERLAAGSYVYLRLRTAAEATVWVASLAVTTPAQPLVRVLVLGRAEEFTSRRLGRQFNPLLFGVVRAAQLDPGPISKGIEL